MKIAELVRNYINYELFTTPVLDFDNDLDIIKNSLLDSISIVKLLVYIEDTFEISLDDVLEIDNFSSVSNITNTISRKLKEKGNGE